MEKAGKIFLYFHPLHASQYFLPSANVQKYNLNIKCGVYLDAILSFHLLISL